jgi:hypothetical protein
MNAPAPVLPVISEETETVIVDALSALHTALASYGAPLPEFQAMIDTVGTNSTDRALDAARITTRAFRALAALSAHRREEKVRAFREGVSEIVQGKVDDALVAKAHIDALPKEARAFLPPFPTVVHVAVSDVSPVFPQGTPEADMIKFLHQLGYKLGKNVKDKASYIIAELGK